MSMPTIDDFTSDELTDYFDYLDDLRESGETNMFGAGPYLMREFGIGRAESHLVLSAWTKTFDGESAASARAFKALENAAA